jgi:hypothetical protein
MDVVEIRIRAGLFKRLQGLAEPLVDTIDTVIEKLCDNWEHNPPSQAAELSRLHSDTFANWGPQGADSVVAQRVLSQAGSPNEHQLRLVKNYLRPYYQNGTVVVSKTTQLPIGLPLTAEYQGSVLKAIVTDQGIEVDGIAYDSPSAAAVAAKRSLGLDEKAAQTNGWSFWTFGRGTPQGAFPINLFRDASRIR